MELVYRLNQIAPVDGPARRESIMGALDRKGNELAAGDRLVIYVSGHGGKGEPTANGLLSTWERGEISVKDLGEALDRFKPEVEVVVVMVQCYSGAFANIIFEGGNPDRPWRAIAEQDSSRRLTLALPPVARRIRRLRTTRSTRRVS